MTDQRVGADWARTKPHRGGRLWPVLGVVTFAVCFALSLDTVLALVERAARFLPPHEIQTDYILGVVWATTLGASILIWPVPLPDRLTLLGAWAAKCVVTLVFMLFYEWNYSVLDAYGYFAAALEPTADWDSVRFGNGTWNINALSWLHEQLLPGSYHAMKVSYAMCGLIAVYVFYRGAAAAMGREDLRLLWTLALFPSILFWSSILGKDPVMLLGIALYAYGVVCWKRRQSAAYLMWTALGALLAVFIRFWLAPILAAPLIVLALVGVRGIVRRIAWCAGGTLLFVAALRGFWDRFAIATLGDLLSTANMWSQAWAEGGSAQTLREEFTGIGSMIRFVPKGMFAALFRPLPGEVMNPFGILAGLENLFLLSLLLLAAIRARWADLKDPVVLWAILLVLTWAAIYGFVSYQNLGTAVRFRLQVLPVLLLLLLHLSRRRTQAGRRVGQQAAVG